MGVSIREVIEHGGYDLNNPEDARWFLSQVNQFEELVVKCEDMLENIEEEENAKYEKEYEEMFGDE